MDTRVIEIAISLALIFALTSLLVSALQEAYSSLTGLRGKVLRKAIVSFVGDDAHFAQALLDHPLLVSLSQQRLVEREQRRPSYANADTVVAALLGHLADTYTDGRRPETPGQLVDALRTRAAQAAAADLAGADAVGPNALFVRGLSALVQGTEHDWPTFQARVAAWYDSVGERSTGWFKRKTQAGVFFLGLAVAAAANLNPIVIASRLWSDEPLRQAVVAAATEASKAYAAAQSASQPGALLGGGALTDDRWKTLCAPEAGQTATDPRLAQLCETLRDLGSLRQLGLPIGWTQAAMPRLFSRDGQPGWGDYLLLMPLGWVIIGLACTLGAPFWFDALGKLVRLRGSGGQSGGQAAGTASAQAAIAGKGMLVQPPAPAVAAAPPPDPHAHADHCEADGGPATEDADLPPARGGVAGGA